MTPFKKLLSQENDDIVTTLVRIVLLLLEAAALQAVDYDDEERGIFQASIRDIRDRFENCSDKTNALILAGEATRSIQAYNKSVEKHIRTLSGEKQSIINMVTESLMRVCHKSESAGQSLSKVVQELEKTHQLEETRNLKLKMAECLAQISREAAHREDQAREMAKPAERGAHFAALDSITGLPGIQDAKACIEELVNAGGPVYAIPLFLKNLDVVNRRFGFASGDEILSLYGQHLERFFSHSDKLFRWRGPCFIAVIERAGRAEAVQGEINKITSAPFEKEIEAGGRSMLFRVSTASMLLPLSRTADLVEVWRKVDAFAAEQIKFKS